jgi:hypothetical protein
MNTEQAATVINAAGALMNSFAWARLLPLLSFVVGGLMLYWMLAKAQRADPTFRAIDFLRDESGKPSWKRLIGTAAFGVHSWVIYIRTVTDKVTFEEQALYVLTWSSSVVLIEAMRIFKGSPAGPDQVQDRALVKPAPADKDQ